MLVGSGDMVVGGDLLECLVTRHGVREYEDDDDVLSVTDVKVMETNWEHPKGRIMIFGVRYVEALGHNPGQRSGLATC